MKVLLICASLFCLLSNVRVEAACADKKSEFIAAVVDIDGFIEVWINTRKGWNERGALVDGYSEEESEKVDIITDKVNLCNLAESTYEPCRAGRTISQIKADLKKACVAIDPAFQKWAENEVRDIKIQ